MPTVRDVADYILAKHGEMPVMKLQKLVYYSQAWSLVWDDRPLFPERIEAWANGPVSPCLYCHHRQHFSASRALIGGDEAALDQTARETVDAVLEYYGDKSAQWLSDLTHLEAPWKEARGNTPEGAKSTAEITTMAMAEYYSSIPLGS